MFSTKQRILILITQPLNLSGHPSVNPTVRDISRGLREHFGITRTRKYIRRILRQLQHEGIITRETRSWQPPRLSNQEQATRYTILDFDEAFEREHSLLGDAKLVSARERERRRRKEARARNSQGE